MQVFCVFLFLSIFFSCKSSSQEEFRYEGACQIRLLLKELKSIETSSDLIAAESVLKKRFEKIVDIAIRARLFQQRHPEEDMFLFQEEDVASEALAEEMRRVYALEGGRECVERAQREAMLRLDAKEKALERAPGR